MDGRVRLRVWIAAGFIAAILAISNETSGG
jgi:hypothetical protein